jgi:hypothetical protein
MDITPPEIEHILTMLAEAPRRLVSLTNGLETGRLQTKADAESWSANDILAHLRSCADVWGKSILAMLAQDNPTLRYVSPRTWSKKTNYLEQEFNTSLQAFINQRNDLLAALKPLAIEGWSRAATFTGTTRGRNQTVFTYAQRIADHEMQHLDQLAGIVHAIQA